MTLSEMMELAVANENKLTKDFIVNNCDNVNDLHQIISDLTDSGIEVVNDQPEYEDVMTDSYKEYLKDVAKYPVLTADEEYACGLKILNGDEDAIDYLVNSNLRLVIHEAKSYASITHIPLMDLIQEGNIGLCEAARKFDCRIGRFSTYATWWIRQTITKSLTNDSRIIRMPANVVDLNKRINEAKQSIENDSHKNASIQEIAEATGIDSSKVQNITIIASPVVSLDTPASYFQDDDKNFALIDTIECNWEDTPEYIFQTQANKEVISSILDTLEPREKEILWSRFGFDSGYGMSLEEVGAKVGLTRERVRQLEIKALNKLRCEPRRGVLQSALVW